MTEAPFFSRKFFKNLCCAGTAAVNTVHFSHPYDVVKTRLQIQGEPGRITTKYDGVKGVIKSISVNEGYKSFYKGK